MPQSMRTANADEFHSRCFSEFGEGMQVAVNGIINGLTIAVLALAFTSVYLPTRVFHMRWVRVRGRAVLCMAALQHGCPRSWR